MSLIAAFVTASGLVVASDTAATSAIDGGHLIRQKIEICGPHAVVGLTGRAGVVYQDGRVESVLSTAVQECARVDQNASVISRANSLAAAIRKWVSDHLPEKLRSQLGPDGSFVTLLVAGFDRDDPVIVTGEVRFDWATHLFEFSVTQQQKPAVAIGKTEGQSAAFNRDPACHLSSDEQRIAVDMRSASRHQLPASVAVQFFRLAVTCSADHAAEVNLPAGAVNWPIDEAVFGPNEPPVITRRNRDHSKK